MKCPYCGGEMQVGYIPNGSQPVQWIPEGEKPAFWAYSKAEHGVSLINRFSWLKAYGSYCAEAHYCSECRIVLAPTKE